MISNLEKYRQDLDRLISSGESLFYAMYYESNPKEFESRMKKIHKDKYEEFKDKLPNFVGKYQPWYSESLVLIKQLLPDRLEDFINQYRSPKPRKEIGYQNYVIDDYLQGLTVTRGYDRHEVVNPKAALPRFNQQYYIVKSLSKRLESSLFDIKQLVQADLFDSELEAAEELNKKGFIRAAGAIAGVVLEKHLSQVCENHNLKIMKKNPGINDYNQLLKDKDVIDLKDWRFIQHLADLRNLCDHDKKKEPKKEDILDLIAGVAKISKTIF